MIDLRFDVIEARPLANSVVPTLIFRLRIEERAGAEVQSAMLRCQIRIEPSRRRYSDDEAEALLDLFGTRDRWGDTMRPMPWTHATTMVPAFSGSVEVDLAVPCTYDFEVAASRLLNALRDGSLPLRFLFNGSVFVRGEAGMQVVPVPWDLDAAFPLPVATWRGMMDTCFAGTAWLRVETSTLQALQRFRARGGHLSWDEAMAALLAQEVPT